MLCGQRIACSLLVLVRQIIAMDLILQNNRTSENLLLFPSYKLRAHFVDRFGGSSSPNRHEVCFEEKNMLCICCRYRVRISKYLIAGSMQVQPPR